MVQRAITESAGGFTLTELLMSLSIVGLLVAITLPVIGVMRDRARNAISRELVTSLTVGMTLYARDDPQHLYPTPAASGLLTYDPADPRSALGQLDAFGWSLRTSSLDRDPSSPTCRCLLDGWRRVIRYRLDGPLRTPAGQVDRSRMNGIADRPAPQLDWNPRGVEPFAYVWSTGRPHGSPEADASPENAGRWIFERSAP